MRGIISSTRVGTGEPVESRRPTLFSFTNVVFRLFLFCVPAFPERASLLSQSLTSYSSYAQNRHHRRVSAIAVVIVVSAERAAWIPLDGVQYYCQACCSLIGWEVHHCRPNRRFYCCEAPLECSSTIDSRRKSLSPSSSSSV